MKKNADESSDGCEKINITFDSKNIKFESAQFIFTCCEMIVITYNLNWEKNNIALMKYCNANTRLTWFALLLADTVQVCDATAARGVVTLL